MSNLYIKYYFIFAKKLFLFIFIVCFQISRSVIFDNVWDNLVPAFHQNKIQIMVSGIIIGGVVFSIHWMKKLNELKKSCKDVEEDLKEVRKKKQENPDVTDTENNDEKIHKIQLNINVASQQLSKFSKSCFK